MARSLRLNSCLGVAFLSAMSLLIATSAAGQPSRCADCHYSAMALAPGPLHSSAQTHLEAWDRSPHGRRGVGCESCHGGNPTTFEHALAHRGIVSWASETSPVNPRNLPATCGRCHAGPYVAFQGSRHYELLRSGQQGPTCSTCHGEVDGRLLSAKALASQCNQCHGPKGSAPRSERADVVREQYQALSVVREQMKLAQTLVRRVNDRERRAQLTEAYDQAQVPLTRALDAGHKFVYDELREHLALAQTRIEALMRRLANR